MEEAGKRDKPSADMIDHLVARFHLDKHNAIVVGDTTHDIHMAQAANIPVIAISHGSHDSERLTNAKPDHLVHSIAELNDLLLSL